MATNDDVRASILRHAEEVFYINIVFKIFVLRRKKIRNLLDELTPKLNPCPYFKKIQPKKMKRAPKNQFLKCQNLAKSLKKIVLHIKIFLNKICQFDKIILLLQKLL